MSERLVGLGACVLEKTASKEEALAVLLGLCDEDFSGRNGSEYVWEKALAAGYSSNAESCFEAALAQGDSYIAAIESTLKTQYESDSYYYDYEIVVVEHDSCYFIATTALA